VLKDIEPTWSMRGVEKTQKFSKGLQFGSPQIIRGF
jgi:hypothetical protein